MSADCDRRHGIINAELARNIDLDIHIKLAVHMISHTECTALIHQMYIGSTQICIL